MKPSTTSVIKYIELRYGKKESYSQEELKTIENLIIDRFDIVGNVQNVNFKDLILFPNLKSLTINNCILDEEIFNILNLTSIDSLYLINCEVLESFKENIFSMNLKNLTLDCTELRYNEIEKIEIDNIHLRDIVTPEINIICKNINIAKATISSEAFFQKLDTQKITICIDQYKEYKDIIVNLNCKISVLENDTEHEIGGI